MIIRKPFIDTFGESRGWGEHDELPLLPAEVDPQLYGSRSSRPQPFYLTCEKDSVLIFMSGSGEVLMRHPDVRRFKAQVGDFVYVPARVPHRVLPSTEIIQYRYKARDAGKEAASWFCETCGEHLHSHLWDTAGVSQYRAYLDAVSAFNATDRTCKKCGAVHPPVDQAGLRWQELSTAKTQTALPGQQGAHHG